MCVVNNIKWLVALNFTLSVGHVWGSLTPDSIFCDEDDLASLEDVGHHGLHAGVAGGGDRQRERVLRLQLEL